MPALSLRDQVAFRGDCGQALVPVLDRPSQRFLDIGAERLRRSGRRVKGTIHQTRKPDQDPFHMMLLDNSAKRLQVFTGRPAGEHAERQGDHTGRVTEGEPEPYRARVDRQHSHEPAVPVTSWIWTSMREVKKGSQGRPKGFRWMTTLSTLTSCRP